MSDQDQIQANRQAALLKLKQKLANQQVQNGSFGASYSSNPIQLNSNNSNGSILHSNNAIVNQRPTSISNTSQRTTSMSTTQMPPSSNTSHRPASLSTTSQASSNASQMPTSSNASQTSSNIMMNDRFYNANNATLLSNETVITYYEPKNHDIPVNDQRIPQRTSQFQSYSDTKPIHSHSTVPSHSTIPSHSIPQQQQQSQLQPNAQQSNSLPYSNAHSIPYQPQQQSTSIPPQQQYFYPKSNLRINMHLVSLDSFNRCMPRE